MTIISSGIYPIDPTITDGTQLAGYINELVEAINSQQASSTRPPMITKGGLWTKTLSGSDIAVMVYDGTNDVEIGKVTGGEIIIGGDSIWTVVDGKAVYDNDIKVNGITVGRGNTTAGTIDTNTAVGQNALTNNTTGGLNTAIGRNALRDNTDGSHNTAVGYYSLVNSSGGNNTAIGRSVGSTLTTGNNNILIGNQAEPSAPDVSNEVTIGNDAVETTRLKGNVRMMMDGSSKFILSKQDGLAKLRIVDLPSTTKAATANVHCDGAGNLFYSTTARESYSVEEVDKKLAIKDKLIEKLEARLKKIEDQLKKKKK